MLGGDNYTVTNIRIVYQPRPVITINMIPYFYTSPPIVPLETKTEEAPFGKDYEAKYEHMPEFKDLQSYTEFLVGAVPNGLG